MCVSRNYEFERQLVCSSSLQGIDLALWVFILRGWEGGGGTCVRSGWVVGVVVAWKIEYVL